MARLVVFLAALFAALAGAGDIYRCKSSDGRIEYRDVACEESAGERIDVKPNVVREIDQSAARAASQAIAFRTAERLRLQEAESAARWANELLPESPVQQADATFYYFPYTFLPTRPAHRPRPPQVKPSAPSLSPLRAEKLHRRE